MVTPRRIWHAIAVRWPAEAPISWGLAVAVTAIMAGQFSAELFHGGW